MVWICDLFDLGPQGQPLCERHADKLRPPQGWAREDRRIDARGTDWAHGTADLGDRPDGRLLRRAFRLPGDDHPERWSLPGEADTEPA